jgi:hypothetical protein
MSNPFGSDVRAKPARVVKPPPNPFGDISLPAKVTAILRISCDNLNRPITLCHFDSGKFNHKPLSQMYLLRILLVLMIRNS